MADDGLAILLGLGGLLFGTALRDKEIAEQRQKVEKAIKQANTHVDSYREEIKRLKAENKALRKLIEQLQRFYEERKEQYLLFQKRNDKLEEYKLKEVVEGLGDSVRVPFEEALRCFLMGNDLAASNMLALTVETIIREHSPNNSKSKKLNDLIEDMAKDKNINPVVIQSLHILRKFRNTQNHTVNKIDELNLLALIQNIGELYKELNSDKRKG